jgi:hypothetical protein
MRKKPGIRVKRVGSFRPAKSLSGLGCAYEIAAVNTAAATIATIRQHVLRMEPPGE